MNSGRPRRVLAVTGSSGGHIFPAVSVIERLCAGVRVTEAVLVLPEKTALPSAEKKCAGLRSAALPYPPPALRRVLGGYAVLLYLPAVFLKSFFLLVYFRPDVVAGFGSVYSVPMILLARLLGIRTIIHEQNVIPGKANLFLSYLCDRIAVSFDGTIGRLGRAGVKAVLTGNPLRSGLRKVERAEAAAFLGMEARKFTVLVTGGSQGSSRINDSFVRAVSLLEARDKLQIIHLTGSKDYRAVKEAYAGCGADARVFEFLASMEYAYSAADLIISRAGAMTVSEIIYYGIPAVIIPYPFAGKHQDANAGVLKRSGLAEVIANVEVSPEALRGILEKALLGRGRSETASGAGGDAAGLLAEEIISLTCR